MKNFIFILLLSGVSLFAQEKKSDPFSDEAFAGLTLRNIGPAFTSGRISDIAIHPEDNNTWYVAVGSGGCMENHQLGRDMETSL